jgi:hypothetical protein
MWCNLEELTFVRKYLLLSHSLVNNSPRNGNLEVPVYFLRPKPEYAVRKMVKDNWIWYILTNDIMCIPDVLLELDTALPHSLRCKFCLNSSFMSKTPSSAYQRGTFLSESTTSSAKCSYSYCCVLQLLTLTGSTVQDVIFSVPHFAKPIFRNILHRYVFLEKRRAGMKFRRKKEVPMWYTGIYRSISITC